MKISEKISEKSVEMINNLIKSTREIVQESCSDCLDKLLVVRGERSLMIDVDIAQYVADSNLAAHLCKLIVESERSEKSHHQVDYLIFTKIANFGKKEMMASDIPEEDKNANGMKKIFEKEAKNMDEFSKRKSLSFFIMSVDGIEIQSFDIIDSVDRSGTITDRVMAPTPEITRDSIEDVSAEKGTRDSLIVIAGNPLINIFDEKTIEFFGEKLNEFDPIVEHSFDYDYRIFKEKSDFIKKRDLELGVKSE
jgi:hypothetical protein